MYYLVAWINFCGILVLSGIVILSIFKIYIKYILYEWIFLNFWNNFCGFYMGIFYFC